MSPQIQAAPMEEILEHWSWPRLMEIITKPDERINFQLAKLICRFQKEAFRLLREAIEDPEHPTSWDDPFIQVIVAVPYEWDGEIPIVNVTTKRGRKLRDRYVALKLLTGGVVVQCEEEGPYPLLPDEILRRMENFSLEEKERLLRKWIKPESWLKPVSIGELEPVGNKVGCVIGRGAGKEFRASIFLEISPHFIDRTNRYSYFACPVGLPSVTPDTDESPSEWSEEERNALWSTIDLFFDKISRIRKVSSVPEKITVDVSAPAGQAGTYSGFEAFFQGTDELDYFDRIQPRRLEDTPFIHFPWYLRGLAGPIINVTDRHGSFTPLASFELLSAMFYPKDQQGRQRFMSAVEVEMIRATVDDMEAFGLDRREIEYHWNLTHAWISSQLGLDSKRLYMNHHSIPLLDDFRPTIRTIGLNGMIAGRILLYLLNCAAHHREHMSVRKAFQTTRKMLLDDTPCHALSQSAIHKAWANFRSVSHLWATYLLWVELGEPDSLSPATAEGLRGFLACSEKLRKPAECLFARSQKAKGSPLLDPTTTWRIPLDLALPEILFEAAPLPQEALQLLKTYKAERWDAKSY